MRLPRRAVAVQQMSRRSSPSRYSRRLSKSRPSPRCCAPAQLQVDLAAAGEKDLLLLAGAQRRVNADSLRERRLAPSARPVPAATGSAHRASPSPSRRARWVRRDSALGGHAGKRGERSVAGSATSAGGRSSTRRQSRMIAAVVFNRQFDLGLAVERRSIGPGAAQRSIAAGAGRRKPSSSATRQHQRVPGQHRVGQPSDPRSPEPARRSRAAAAPMRARRQAESPAPPPLASGADRGGMERGRDHCLGTGTAAITSASTRSASKPSSSASGLSITRWRSTGWTARFTSSGTR